MSHADDAADVLSQVNTIGADHPKAQELRQAAFQAARQAPLTVPPKTPGQVTLTVQVDVNELLRRLPMADVQEILTHLKELLG